MAFPQPLSLKPLLPAVAPCVPLGGLATQCWNAGTYLMPQRPRRPRRPSIQMLSSVWLRRSWVTTSGPAMLMMQL
eukprot:5676347-Heterocapsa_arctica.AAC.1